MRCTEKFPQPDGEDMLLVWFRLDICVAISLRIQLRAVSPCDVRDAHSGLESTVFLRARLSVRICVLIGVVEICSPDGRTNRALICSALVS